MKRFDLDPKKLWVERISLNLSGMEQYTCFSRQLSAPVALAWVLRSCASTEPGNSKLKRTELLEIWTEIRSRRCGAAIAIHRAIFADDCDLIFTGQGTPRGGMDLMKALGYRMEKTTGFWVLRKEWFNHG